jgi:23S rRNA (uracil1939-C5)-methyltransferase
MYVPGALPGEVVEGEVSGGRMEAPRIVTPSPDRIRAPCPHYRSCGGCSVMHAGDSFVANWKECIVREALAAQDLPAPLRPIATSPAFSRRRATFAGRRTKSGAIVGFHGRASGTLAEIPHCRLLTPGLTALAGALGPLVEAGASRSGVLDLAATETDTGFDLAVTGGKPLDPALGERLADLLPALRIARLSWNGETLASLATPALRIGAARVALPPGAFLQATREGEAVLQEAVRDAVRPARRVADLFAGLGTFSLPLSETAEVHAVEGGVAMLAALSQGWRSAPGLKRLTTETRDLFRRPLLPDELAPFDAIVIDPPRAGAEAQQREIARSGVRVVASVSCNPVTFARDTRILTDAGFRLDWVRPVDQFRWSTHVEVIARLSR